MIDEFAVRERNRQIGREIARRRKAADWNQADLGAKVGLSGQQIAKYERGEDSLRVFLWEGVAQGA